MARRLLHFATALSFVAPWTLTTGSGAASADLLPPKKPTITIDATRPPSSTADVIDTTWSGLDPDSHPQDMNFEVTLSQTGAPTGAPSPTAVPTSVRCNQSSSSQWDCSEPWPLFKDNYVLNGTYQVTVSGTAYRDLTASRSPSQTAATTIKVANPPVPTKNVAAALQPDSTVKITWDPSPEPDVFAYAVFRSKNGQPTTEVDYCDVTAGSAHPCPSPLSRVDGASGGGVFSYQVLAYRYGATYSGTDAVSAASTATKAVTVPGPPAPTTTIAPSSPPATSATVALGGAARLPAATFPAVSPTPGSPPIIGGSSAATLPADPPVQPPAPSDPAAVGKTASAPADNGSHHSVGSWGAVAAALLLVVLAMVGLWVRGQVKQAGILEPLEPGGA